MDGFLTAAFWAVASCTAVHIGFGIFGLEQAIHSIGHGAGLALGTIPPDAPMHVCGMGDIFNSASTSAAVPMPPTNGLETIDLSS